MLSPSHDFKLMEGYQLTLFLTGSTGFLGAKLLANLLSTTNHTLYVLVRDVNKGKRLVETLGFDAQNRITLVQGDITLTHCGLTESTLEELKENVDVFYHIAALVKFDEELRDELFNVNLEGTKNALELAKTLFSKKFIYVSTAYTVGKRRHGVEELYPIDAQVHNPYEESKVQSEHLVFAYADVMNVSIFRPSIIVGDSETGEADSEFTLYGFMRALEVFKRRVDRNSNVANETYRLVGSKLSTSNLVPVNYVADILALAATKSEASKIYNITNPNPPTNFDLLQHIKKALQFSQLEIVESTTSLTLTTEEVLINDMIRVFNAYLSRSFNFDDTNTQQLIVGSTIQHLNLSVESMELIINAYFKTIQ